MTAAARIMPALLKAARESRAVSTGEMAKRLGMAQTEISRAESAKWARPVSETLLLRWAAALKMTLPDLLAFSQDTKGQDQ